MLKSRSLINSAILVAFSTVLAGCVIEPAPEGPPVAYGACCYAYPEYPAYYGYYGGPAFVYAGGFYGHRFGGGWRR